MHAQNLFELTDVERSPLDDLTECLLRGYTPPAMELLEAVNWTLPVEDICAIEVIARRAGSNPSRVAAYLMAAGLDLLWQSLPDDYVDDLNVSVERVVAQYVDSDDGSLELESF